jgi:hypothetical protein
MTMHHHLHSPFQKHLWSRNAGRLLFLSSSVLTPCIHLFVGTAAYGLPTSSTPSLFSSSAPSCATSTSSTEAVGVRDFIAEDGTASASTMSSSCTSSSSSSKSLRMMTLSSPGGPWSPRLRSMKSHLVNSSSYEVLTMRSSSSKEQRSTTKIFSEGPP